MVKLYYDLIKAGRWDLKNVMPPWYDDVVALLEADKEKENK